MLVATCTDRAEIIGEADTAEEALAIIQAWAKPHGLTIDAVKQADVMIDMPEPGQDRFPRAWVADNA